jgi:alpha-maltose-1-phosphate synthase
MQIAILTREFPPDIYGGAGVHVDYLVRDLRTLIDVDVHCWGEPREGAEAHKADPRLKDANAALQTLSIDLTMAAGVAHAAILHSHTWYANMGGHIGKLLHGVPHVITAHSLEPHRPWKAEQLAGGYRVSSWCEKTAYEGADAIIAVSAKMRRDIIEAYPALDPDRVHVILNGIDTEIYKPVEDRDFLVENGVDLDRPIVAFVGRITRQKGVKHLIAAAHKFGPDTQLVLCAGAPDTPEIAAETKAAIETLQAARKGVIWLNGMLTLPQVKQVLSAADVFCCPSVYEPLGIVNLEAMACNAAVVASDVGGIPEVVKDGVTGLLVHYDENEPEKFETEIAARVNELIDDPARAKAMAQAGRDRAVNEFSWMSIAEQTVELYKSLI